MGTLGVILIFTAAMGFAVLSTRYFLAAPPMVHHSAVMSHDGVEVTEGHERIFATLYKIVGSVSLSMALLVASIALFAVRDDGAWARLVIMLISGILAYGGVLVPLEVERATGVRMPWRPSIAITSMMFFGALLSWF